MNSLSTVTVLMCVGSVVRGASIQFPEDNRPEGGCLTKDGQEGRCVPASSGRCSLYPTTGHLLAARPKICEFIPHDPLICCPIEAVLAEHTTTSTTTTTTTTEKPTTASTTTTTKSTTASTTTKSTTVSTTTKSPTTTEPTRRTEKTTPAPGGGGGDEGGLSGRLGACGVSQPTVAFLSEGQYLAEPPAGAAQQVLLGEQPWSALVGFRTTDGSALAWICGGVLVQPRVVLTAGHCVVLGGSPQRLAVRLGEHDLNTDTDGPTVERGVVAVTRHPLYQPPAQRHDLALLLLDSPVPLTQRSQLICLPDPDSNRTVTQTGTAVQLPVYDLSGDLTGLEASQRGVLTVPEAQVAPMSACSAILSQLPHTEFIFPGGVSAEAEVCVRRTAGGCGQDSGGPLVVRDQDGAAVLAGLQLLGGCQPDTPEAALRIQPYLQFIQQGIDDLLAAADQPEP